MTVLNGKSIVLGVSGGIAAYKAATIASLLVQSGARVQVIMTDAAQRFVRPLTFAAITHDTVHTDPFAPWSTGFSGHVSLAADADLLVIAPATAATIARLALGLSDDLLGLVALATPAPILIAPAMEERMFHHSATQGHLSTLAARGANIVGPDRGRLASVELGTGRMVEPDEVVNMAKTMVGASSVLSGVKVVVTAGGTQEPLDPVRYLGNRSSGRMGYALARAALAAGADVTLISAPTYLVPPHGVTYVEIETASEMQAAVERSSRAADLLIMAAAIADFRPEERQNQKIKKETTKGVLDLRLVRNPDILAEIDRPGLVKIGFAAETDDLMENAAHKLRAKGLAMIVANDAEATIAAPESTATILTADGAIRPLARMSKEALAVEIIQSAALLLPEAGPRPS